MVKFCDKCGALLTPRRNKDNSITLICKICKTESKESFYESSYQISSKIKHSEKDKLTVVEEDFDIRPSIKVACPRCNNYEARYWEAEDRRKEEWETTTYYKCTKCNWVWSE